MNTGLPQNIVAKVLNDLDTISQVHGAEYKETVEFCQMLLSKIAQEPSAGPDRRPNRPTTLVEEIMAEYGGVRNQAQALARMLEACFLQMRLNGSWDMFVAQMVDQGAVELFPRFGLVEQFKALAKAKTKE